MLRCGPALCGAAAMGLRRVCWCGSGPASDDLPGSFYQQAGGHFSAGAVCRISWSDDPDALANRTEEDDDIRVLSPLRSVVYIFGGMAAIVWGGNLVVDSAKAIALSFGLSQTLVGLTVVALGTSLPELVTSVVASRKGENGLALGNVIGSNIFNHCHGACHIRGSPIPCGDGVCGD